MSDWEEDVPEDAMTVDEKTQYHTMERITTTDPEPPKEGFTCVDDYWKDPEHKQCIFWKTELILILFKN